MPPDAPFRIGHMTIRRGASKGFQEDASNPEAVDRHVNNVKHLWFA